MFRNLKYLIIMFPKFQVKQFPLKGFMEFEYKLKLEITFSYPFKAFCNFNEFFLILPFFFPLVICETNCC